MNRGIWIAVALLVAAAPVHGQDQAKKDATGAKATPAPKPGAKKGGKDAKAAAPKQPDAGGSAAWGTGTPGKEPESVARKKSAAPPAKNAAQRVTMLRLRSTYRYAVESCERQGKDCDGTLRADAERRFLDSCLECTTREKCEAERDFIRTGESKSQTTLCAE